VTDALGKLAPRSPRRLLDELAAKGQKAAAGGKDRPLVTIHLSTGHDVSGRVVALGDDGGLAVVALHVGGTIALPQVAHVRLDHVVAVTHDLANERSAIADQPVPGRLELMRALHERGGAINAKIGKTLELALHDPLSDDDRRSIGIQLSTLIVVLSKLADDDMGRDALKALDMSRVGCTPSGNASKNAGVLLIEVPRAEDAWDERTAKATIEKAL
jgi:hypothetical protein